MGVKTRGISNGYGSFAAEVCHTTGERTDVIYQDARLYIEGIEVPFAEIQVSEPYMELPVATLTLPYYPGLTEIGRNYFPKVHVFYRDVEAERYFLRNNIPYSHKDIYRLKFSGVIHRYSYSKSSSPSGTNQGMSFHCVHKNYLMNEIITKFNGRGVESAYDRETEAAVSKATFFGSRQMILHALTPVKPAGSPGSVDELANGGDNPDADISVLPSYLAAYQERVQGIPGYLVNIWNCMRRDSYSSEDTGNGMKIAQAMIKMYIPAVEEGIRFFQRMSGHPYIENQLANSKVPTAGSNASKDPGVVGTGSSVSVSEVILPPILRTAVGSAASVDLAVSLMESYMAHTNELTNIMQIFKITLRYIRYDMVTLGSPVQSPSAGTEGIETLIKPLMVTYFSPTCNVILPTLYNSISVEESYYDVPTRLSCTDSNPVMDGAEMATIQYRAPHFYRKAVANLKAGFTDQRGTHGKLVDTLAFYYEGIGAHEEGQGIRHKFTEMEGWVKYLITDQARMEDAVNASTTNLGVDRTMIQKAMTESYDDATLSELAEAWFQANRPRHNNTESYRANEAPDRAAMAPLNPWSTHDVNGLSSPGRNVMTTLEYDYSLSLVQSRIGRVNGVFNPYAIPGYPCDIISKNFAEPSYHAFITSVDTTFSASGMMGTSMSFSCAFTYDELHSYSLPGSQPWLSAALKMTKNPFLTRGGSDGEAYAAAAEYYQGALGVGVALPTALYDFNTGKGKLPVMHKSGSIFKGVTWPEKTSGDYGQAAADLSYSALSTEGALAMVRREIETISDVEENSGGKIKFIPLPRNGYQVDTSGPTDAVPASVDVSEYRDMVMSYRAMKEVGKSAFLHYSDDPED